MSAKKTATQQILSHPDRDEIINKLLLNISPEDVHNNLAIRYSNPAEKKFVLSVKILQTFTNNSLDLYQTIKQDLSQIQTLSKNQDQELELAIKGNSAYKETLQKLAGHELDVKITIVNMITALNTRIEQIFNEHQMDPSNINTRTERLFNEMIAQWKGVMELYHKYVLQAPDQIVQHNITVQHIDSHIQVIQDAIKETLQYFDIEVSLRFIEIMTEKLNKLNLPTEIKTLPTEQRLAEAKIVNEQINERLNDQQ